MCKGHSPIHTARVPSDLCGEPASFRHCLPLVDGGDPPSPLLLLTAYSRAFSNSNCVEHKQEKQTYSFLPALLMASILLGS